ncbi:MAG: hypothetical protein HY898_15885 [Deltaproteobacteria bacterium]|nr:hypothetical protein [Deltaproteobacteria bacterium]
MNMNGTPGSGMWTKLSKVALSFAALLAISACSSSDSGGKSAECEPCSNTSECEQGLACHCFCYAPYPGCCSEKLCAKSSTKTCS